MVMVMDIDGGGGHGRGEEINYEEEGDENVFLTYNSKGNISAKESYHFQEPDISIVGENFQPYNKKIIGYPGRTRILEKVENLDMTKLRQNLKNIRDNFDKYIGIEAEPLKAARRLNEDLGETILFFISDINIGLQKSVSSLKIYADNFCIVEDSKLYFTLNIETENFDLRNFLWKYFKTGKSVSFDHVGGTLSIESMPCNEPIVTEYVSNFVYSYKQFIKYTSHNYEYSRDNNYIRNNILIKNKKDDAIKYMEILNLYLRENNPDIDAYNFRNYVGDESYFKLDVSFNKLTISFYNIPFELAEYRYKKIRKEVKYVNQIIGGKHKLIDVIENTTDDLTEILSGKSATDKLSKQENVIKIILKSFNTYKNLGDTIESAIYIPFLEDILEDGNYLTPNDINNLSLLGNDKYKVIISYYTNLIKREIRGNKDSIFSTKYSSQGEKEDYIAYILDLLTKIDGIYPKMKGTEGFLLQFKNFSKTDINNFHHYHTIGKAIMKWLHKERKGEDYNDFAIDFAKNLIKTIDMPYLFETIKNGKGNDIQTSINKCLKNYKDTFSTELIDMIEQLLFVYSFITTIFYQKSMLDDNNMEKLDFSLFDQFANILVFPTNLTIGHVREGKNGYETSGEGYYSIMRECLEDILSPKQHTRKLQSLDVDDLKKATIRLYFGTFKEKYGDIDEQYKAMFMDYFTDEQKVELYKRSFEIKWDRIITQFIEGYTVFDEYDKLLKDNSFMYSMEELESYKKRFEEVLVTYILDKHLQKVKNNQKLFIDKNQFEKIFSYLSEDAIKNYHKKETEYKLEGRLEKDIKELEQGITTIDASKYQSYDIISKKLRKQMKTMISLKQQNDKKYILANKEKDVNIESIVVWYDILKEKFPDFIEEIQKILREVYKEGDKNRGLLDSFQEIENALKEGSFDSKNIENFIEALEYYIKISYIDVTDITWQEETVLRKSIIILFSFIFTEDNKVRDIEKIIKFLEKVVERNNGIDSELLLLNYMQELYELDKFFPDQNLKYVHILVGIINKVAKTGLQLEKSKIILYSLLNQLIKVVNILETNNQLSYEQSKDIVDRIKDSKINKYLGDISTLDNSEFVMMLKYF